MIESTNQLAVLQHFLADIVPIDYSQNTADGRIQIMRAFLARPHTD